MREKTIKQNIVEKGAAHKPIMRFLQKALISNWLSNLVPLTSRVVPQPAVATRPHRLGIMIIYGGLR